MNISDCRVGVATIPGRADGGACAYEDTGLIEGVIREALAGAGLGEKNAGAPMADIIEQGMTVLLKPNWVLHFNQADQGMDCMVTHPAFILAALKEVLAARPGRVIIADAPIQSCRFDLLATPEFRQRVAEMATCPVEVVDFRKMVLAAGGLAEGMIKNPREEGQYVLFDLGEESLLEPVSSPAGRFRVTCYDPDVLARAHRPGRHQYVLSREAFEADVILNLPKLKTHRKAGITAALKNLVGINGDKDFLPHHRLGGSALGGDCYQGVAPLKRAAEYCLDNANRNIGGERFGYWNSRFDALMKWQAKVGDLGIDGGWHGNDTTWRMVLDLNRLALYGRPDGTLSDTRLRRVYSLTDAIVAGERNGPLSPSPINLGAVTFAASSPFADLVHSALMRFDWKVLPLIGGAFGGFRYRLTDRGPEDCEVHLRGRRVALDELAATCGMDFRPPDRWAGHVELNRLSPEKATARRES
jgi:uncharacterized protein (DUF362 family)